MRNFIIFFEEKEGTTVIVRLLNNFPQVDVIRARGEWEPFNRHACGPMPLPALRRCLDLVYSGAPVAAANEIYRRTATRSLSRYRGDPDFSRGFKMRFTAPRDPRVAPGARFVPGLVGAIESLAKARFRRVMVDVLKQHDVLVFIAVRQNLLRWALSKYHGDGTGRPGHLQFKLASGRIEREEIPRITVDPDALQRVIAGCQEIYDSKRRLAARLRDAGLEVATIRYEDFLDDREAFFAELLGRLGHELPPDEIREALAHDVRLKRVHGDDLSEFFTNAEELEARFGDRVERWP